MATTKFYLDQRACRKDGTALLKIALTKKGKTALISLDLFLFPNQWDNKVGKIINHPQKSFLNNYITRKRADIETFILHLEEEGSKNLSAQDLKSLYVASLSPDEPANSFERRFIKFIEKKSGTTKQMYQYTLKKLRLYAPSLSQLTFEDISSDWLEGFDAFLAQTAPSKNYRNIHLRNIRAVFNSAIEAEETAHYPFRKFKIRPVPTRKRSLTVEELRSLFSHGVEPYAEIYRDMFKLIFMLIGINNVDLHRLKHISPDGRIDYIRAKTHRLYSIKVEPEAAEIIEKYKGTKGLLCISDRWTDHRNFTHQTNKALQRIGLMEMVNKKGKKKITPAFPELTTYWARHTWATIASSLDIPKETIAAALGHGGNTVTDIYINFDQRKVDEANRRVLDWVLYEKKR